MCEFEFRCHQNHVTIVSADEVMDNEGNAPGALQCMKCLKESGYFVWAFNCGTINNHASRAALKALPNDDEPMDAA